MVAFLPLGVWTGTQIKMAGGRLQIASDESSEIELSSENKCKGQECVRVCSKANTEGELDFLV